MSETIRVAFGEILANPLRSGLTMLGIVVGVAALITMVALGTGAQLAVEAQLEALGTDLISIRPGQSRGPGGHGVARGERVSLTTDDAAALARAGTFKAVVPELSGRQAIEFGPRNARLDVVATTPAYVDVNNYDVIMGRMFTDNDNQARNRVAVLGFSVPNELGTDAIDLIGSEMVVGGVRFDVIGLLSEKGSQGWDDPDERVLIPLNTGQFRTFGSDRIRSITIQVAHQDSMDHAMLDIEGILRQEHSIRPGTPNDFNMRNQSQFLAAEQETTETFTFLLAGVAAVSLIVGGIGIMNIMLVSVTERTREIGVRKALGATRRVILGQFLIEAVTVCGLGGLVGVLVGVGGSGALSRWQGWTTHVSPQAIMVAVVFSAGIGIFFGMMPARRAARLDPIEALRHE